MKVPSASTSGSITTVKPRVGQALDPDVHSGRARCGVPLRRRERPSSSWRRRSPTIDDADIAEARDTFANPAVSGPVTLTFDKATIKLFPKDYTPALSLAPVDGKLAPQLDTAKLAEVVSANVVADGGAPVDATVALVGGAPKVIPAKPGVTYDQAQIDAGFLALVAAPDGSRTLNVDAKVAQPEFTTKDARALQIKERVSTFTTYYPYAEYRNVNIGRAAELVNGTVLKPGETFSLNDTVGERTVANGFTEGYVISDGILITDLGGGVSQMATTTFNAMFFAGLEDVEHKPHSFYIDRYPIGREATVAWGAVDLQFRNDTPYGVLISANVTPATVGLQRRRDRLDVLHEALEHHHLGVRALQRDQGEGAQGRHRAVPRQRGLRRLRHRREALLRARRCEHRDPRCRELPHDLHPVRHGDLHQPGRRGQRQLIARYPWTFPGCIPAENTADSSMDIPGRADTYGVRRCRSRGNGVTSRMLVASTSRATQRSSPIAKPPCGGIPCLNAWRYAA